MKYIIMCGGEYKYFKKPKQLLEVYNEVIVERTIRLLKENGITDIAISTNNPAFDYIDIPKLSHKNNYIHAKEDGEAIGWWLDAFYPSKEPTCYLWGDVYFSEEAIKKIVNTEVKDIELFGSAPPFSKYYYKKWIEPFALKVNNIEHLWEAIKKTKEYALEGKTWRKDPIIWELWTVIKDMPLQTEYGKYVYNYTAINDYTTDIDDNNDIRKLNYILKLMKGEIKMVKVEVIERFTLRDFKQLKNIVRKNADNYGELFVGDIFECDEDMAKYLTGDNKLGKAVVKVIEVIPKTVKIEEEDIKTIAKEVNKVTKKTTKKKASKK